MRWRVGGKIALNVYEGDVPMFQCHRPEDAVRIVHLLNAGTVAQTLSNALEFALRSLGNPVDTNLRLAAVLKGNRALESFKKAIEDRPQPADAQPEGGVADVS
jgi:hypothetical protein